MSFASNRPRAVVGRPGRWLPALVALALGMSSVPAIGEPVSPVVVSGTGVLEKASIDSGESMSIRLNLKNATNQPLTIKRAETFFACQGGWLSSLGEMIGKDGKFFGNAPMLGAGANDGYRFQYGYSTPVTHYLLALKLDAPGGPSRDELFQVPFVRKGFEAPAPLRVKAPVFLALQEPVEVLSLASGQTWLPIIGQLANTSGKPLTLKRWRFRLKNAAGKLDLDQDLLKTYPLDRSNETIHEYLYSFALPKTFTKGDLQIEAEVDLGGQRLTLAHDVPVERIKAHTVKAPVEGRWNWNNGPGEMAFHTHFHFPEQRYSYDLLVNKNVQARRRTFDGDPGKNESYFAWNQPIHCVEDGKVITVIDDVPDNFGNKPNPANRPERNAVVVVEHPGQGFSEYVHVRQGSAKVKVGQSVKAGEVLAHLGNAGMSSEPHLHFGYQRLDPSGRFRTVPLAIEGLKTPDGRPATGVPKGRVEYVSASSRSKP